MSAATLLAIAALALLGFGLWLFPWPRPRPARRWLRGVAAVGMLLIAVLMGLLAAALQRYRPWLEGALIAEVAIVQRGAQQFEATLSLPGHSPQRFGLHGDQWQIDVRLLRWKLPGALLGAPRIYRIDRLSGRFADVDQARSTLPSVHALGTPDEWDAFQLKRRLAGWMPLLDADYGSSAYLPMIDGTRFHVAVGDVGGIVVRPADAESLQRLRDHTW